LSVRRARHQDADLGERRPGLVATSRGTSHVAQVGARRGAPRPATGAGGRLDHRFVCHSAAPGYQWFSRISPQKCSIRSRAAAAGSNSSGRVQFLSVGTSSGRKRRRYPSAPARALLLEEPHRNMNAEKSESAALSRGTSPWPAAGPLGDGVHLIVAPRWSSLSSWRRTCPTNVLLHVPADGFERRNRSG